MAADVFFKTLFLIILFQYFFTIKVLMHSLYFPTGKHNLYFDLDMIITCLKILFENRFRTNRGVVRSQAYLTCHSSYTSTPSQLTGTGLTLYTR